ncbi:hypothetical protein MSUIS_07800 [Mycoplasma suis KI3806]|uniref:Uncharacterized protein n=1 Tax=Mycoplasma suis (strain KI_3806) TaxID=708248 RepID=F0V2J2_MYCS3|nr:iron-sulfur cluster scaffold-like protein [Mycoplasma suis]CBZ40873.1 hypothetical protein MSUIS_07800 [Mycoplasma suis KI3806]
MIYQDLIYKLAFLDKFSFDKEEKEDLNLVDFKSCQHYISFQCELNPLIEKIKLSCKGCILFRASSNAICLEIEGKTKEEALKITKKFLDMLDGKYERAQEINEKYLELFWKFQHSTTRKECLKSGAQEILNYLLTK